MQNLLGMPCEHNQPESMQYDPGFNDLAKKFAAKFAQQKEQIIPIDAINAFSDIRALAAFIRRKKQNLCIDYYCSEQTAIENGISNDHDARSIMEVLEHYFIQKEKCQPSPTN